MTGKKKKEKTPNVFFPQVLATWRLYLFTVKVPTKVNAPAAPGGIPLVSLDLWVICRRCDAKVSALTLARPFEPRGARWRWRRGHGRGSSGNVGF